MAKKSTKRGGVSSAIIPGSLFIVEGIDGSGKSTQLEILKNLLEANGFAVVLTAWNSSPAVRPLNKKVKAQRSLSDLVDARTFSLTHAADMADRFETAIRDALACGKIVLCDRYMYTDLARGVARGAPEEYLRHVYSFLPKPDLAFYFQVPIKIALERATARANLKFYEAGMDLGLSENIFENFKYFQTKVIENYERLAQKDKLVVIDGTKAIYLTTPDVKRHVVSFIKKKYGVTMF